MKKVMILGASVGQLPIIKKAKELGYELAVVDYNDQAVGIPYADKFYHASTIDEEAVIAAAMDYKPNGITTVQTDMPMRAIAAACTALGIAGINSETALKATDKEKMIQAFKQHNISSPWYCVLTEKENTSRIKGMLNFPCIVKPADNSGSRGVSLVHSECEIEKALEYSRKNSRNGRVIIEEYMQGPEVSVEVLMVDGKANILAVTDKLTTGAPHFVELGHNEQSRLEKENIEAIKNLAGSALKAIGVDNGPGHVEIIVTNEGPKMVELGARLGGDFITTDLVPLSTGIDMLALVLKLACGEKPEILPKFDKGSAIRFIVAEEGIITSIYGIEEAKNSQGVVKVELLREIGDYIPPLCSSLDRVGYVITQAENAQLAVEQCEKALRKIKVKVSKSRRKSHV